MAAATAAPHPASATHTVADHLLDRLVELGVDRIFGVPGDFTLGFLDHIDAHPGIEWVGTANELGAGYAADGYARVRGVGVVCTTFGVGELSAINAIAGSYAERVPVLHLVGSPSTTVQAAGRAVHHSLGDGDFRHTLRMAAEVTVDQALLGAGDPTGDIDRVLAAMLTSGLPGYLSVPTDIAEAAVPVAAGPLPVPARRSDAASLVRFAEAAAAHLRAHPGPVVLADVFVSRAHADDELRVLLATGAMPYASLLWGRRVVDEAGAGYLGTYVGAASEPAVREAVEGAPCLITVGVHFTDLISGSFSEHLDPSRQIDVLAHAAAVAGEAFANIEMADALRVLTDLVHAGGTADLAVDGAPCEVVTPAGRGALTQEELWTVVAGALLPGDLVLADQGTAFYGMGRHHLPHDALFIGQPLWAAIGYTLPAVLGAALADPTRRPVLLIGDGAAQLTIQELGTILRHDIPLVMVVANNNGYTVERAIHGPTKRYNDIAPWRWTELPNAFGAAPGASASFRATTVAELVGAFADAAANPTRLTLIEAVTGELDVPPLLVAVAAAAAAANSPTVVTG